MTALAPPDVPVPPTRTHREKPVAGPEPEPAADAPRPWAPLSWREDIGAELRRRAVALAVAAVPLLVATGFAAVHLGDLREDAGRMRDVQQAVAVSTSGTALLEAVAHERDLATDPRAHGATDAGAARDLTDDRAAQFRQELERTGPDAPGTRARAEAPLTALAEARAVVGSGGAAEVDSGYQEVLHRLADLSQQVGGDADVSAAGRGLFLLTLDDALLTGQRALLSAAEKAGHLDPGSRGLLLASRHMREATAREFAPYAEPTDAQVLRSAARDRNVRVLTDAIGTPVAAQEQDSSGPSLPAGWYEDMSHEGEQLAELRAEARTRFTTLAQVRADRAWDRVLTDGTVSVLVLLATFPLTYAVALRLTRRAPRRNR